MLSSSSSSSASNWLPLQAAAHLPLAAFANCYASAVCSLPAADGAATSRPLVLIAAGDTVYALRHSASTTAADPPSPPLSGLGLQRRRVAAASATPSLSSLEPLPLAKLPHGSEIIAMHAFNQRDGRLVLCVAVGLVTAAAPAASAKTPSHAAVPSRFNLLIYGAHTLPTTDLAAVGADVQQIRLTFVPFVLTSSTLLSAPSAARSGGSGGSDTDILLSGSDRVVHLYRQSSADSPSYSEVAAGSSSHPLSCLSATPSSALSLSIHLVGAESHSVVAVAGYQDGLVRVATIPLKRNSEDEAEGAEQDASDARSPWHMTPDDEAEASAEEVTWNDLHFDGPVCSASLFSPSSVLCDVFRSRDEARKPLNDSKLNQMQRRAFDAIGRGSNQPQQSDARLLVANAVGFGAVYSSFDLPTLSFSDSCFMNGAGCFDPNSFCSLVDAATDSVLCASAIDLNMDGRAEVLLGTYSSQMLVFQEGSDGEVESAEERADARSQGIAPSGYTLAANKQFSHPIYSIAGVDLLGHGVEDLVVTTMYSVDVLSWQVDSAVDVLSNKLECLDEIQQLEKALREMQAAATAGAASPKSPPR